MNKTILSGIFIIFSITLISILSTYIGTPASNKTQKAAKNFIEECVKLINEAQQDSNPIFALVHATEALTWAKALSQLSGEANISKIFGPDALDLERKAKAAQEYSVQRLING